MQDALITVLSEKTLPVPELGSEVQAVKGFNVIATANDRDRGVNELSSALRRRFNTVVLPLPAGEDEEVDIVARRVAELGRALELPPAPAAAPRRSAASSRVFRELRSGRHRRRADPAQVARRGTLSTAEAISVVTSGLALAAHFGDGVLRAADVAGGLVGAVVKDPVADRVAWNEYLEAVVRDARGWGDFYRACREVTDERGARPSPPRTGVGCSAIRHHGPGFGAVACWPRCDRLQPGRRARSRARPTPTRCRGSPRARRWCPGRAARLRAGRRRTRPPSGRSRCSRPEWQAMRWAAGRGVLRFWTFLRTSPTGRRGPARPTGIPVT